MEKKTEQSLSYKDKWRKFASISTWISNILYMIEIFCQLRYTLNKKGKHLTSNI